MSFLETYKRLDNLCKDLLHSETGVTAYITAMEQCSYAASYVSGWDSDYKSLKRYRYIRNRIVHDDGATETGLCVREDTLWLEHFYRRIIQRVDPLALYESARRGYAKKSVQAVPAQHTNNNIQQKIGAGEGRQRPKRKPFAGVLVVLFVIAFVYLLLMWITR